MDTLLVNVWSSEVRYRFTVDRKHARAIHFLVSPHSWELQGLGKYLIQSHGSDGKRYGGLSGSG